MDSEPNRESPNRGPLRLVFLSVAIVAMVVMVHGYLSNSGGRIRSHIDRLRELRSERQQTETGLVLLKLRKKLIASHFGPSDFPPNREELLARLKIKELPQLAVAGHEPQNNLKLYQSNVCSGQFQIDSAKISDSGSWALVVSSDLKCGGWLFIDCTHADYTQRAWNSY
jgi:hypothetical protein